MQQTNSQALDKTLIQYPKCVNQQQARMVCLNNQCDQHPFFCNNCEQPSCELIHQHQDKLTSISYKQFSKRVCKEKKPIQKLSQAMKSYRAVLEKLKNDVNKFIEKELAQLDSINQKATTIALEDEEVINRLKTLQYDGLTGKVMDRLWSNFGDNPEKIQGQEQTSDFIKIKEDEVKGISEHFQHLNQMDQENIEQNDIPSDNMQEQTPPVESGLPPTS